MKKSPSLQVVEKPKVLSTYRIERQNSGYVIVDQNGTQCSIENVLKITLAKLNLLVINQINE